MEHPSALQLSQFETNYRALLARVMAAWEELGGKAAMTGEVSDWSNPETPFTKKQFQLEAYASLATELQSGGMANTLNFLHNKDLFTDIDTHDELGMLKLFIQLSSQSVAIFKEAESKLVEMTQNFEKSVARWAAMLAE